MFRTADGIGIRHLHLCGITPTPENPKVLKTSLGAEAAVPWTYYPNGVLAAAALVGQGFHLWALEREPRSESLSSAAQDLPNWPLVLVVGNEVCGVDPGILELCERVVSIPMVGSKGSFNVAVAFGMASLLARWSPTNR